MIRFLVSAPLAVFFSLLLFYGLALITSTGERPQQDSSMNPALDFLMVRRESELELRHRQPPPPPERVQPQELAIPEPDTVKAFNFAAPRPNLQVPDISMEMDLQLSPSLHNLKMPKPVVEVDTNPVVLSRVPPRYPQRALQLGLEGKVVVEFIITATGAVKEGSLVVIESTPPGIFDRAVKRAIKRWKFKQRLLDGQAIEFKARQELAFKLNQ